MDAIVTDKVIPDTMMNDVINLEVLDTWAKPPFQRDFKSTKKVREVAQEIKETETIPGVVTLGLLAGVTYLLDGQHRVEAAKSTGLTAFITNLRLKHCRTMADMADEFRKLNQPIKSINPDDKLRSMEFNVVALALIRKECPFVGYSRIRSSKTSPRISMSVLLRSWHGSRGDGPVQSHLEAPKIAEILAPEEAVQLSRFANLMFAAWGSEPGSEKMWGALNVTVCSWLFRMLVADRDRTHHAKRYVVMTDDEFRKCLLSLAANAAYGEWLVGRQISQDKDRVGGYEKVKAIFLDRLSLERQIDRKKLWLPKLESQK